MKPISRLCALFFLGAAFGLPSGMYVVQHKFVAKEKARGMLGEEDLADLFAKTQFTHADTESAREALLYAIKVHNEMQISNSKNRGWPENMDLGWCYAELSALEESAGNADLAGKYRVDAYRILDQPGVKDSTMARLWQVIKATQATPSLRRPTTGEPR